MRAGNLRHRVQVQEDRGAANEFNEAVPAWRTFALRWAEIVPEAGTDALVSDQRRQAVTHKVRIRYLANLTVQHRLLTRDGRHLYISAVLNVDERSREMMLDCVERVGA